MRERKTLLVRCVNRIKKEESFERKNLRINEEILRLKHPWEISPMEHLTVPKKMQEITPLDRDIASIHTHIYIFYVCVCVFSFVCVY